MKRIKLVMTAWFSLGIALLFSVSAAAYIDPAVVSYTIPAVAGIIIAGGAIFFAWWRKVKSKVSKKLGIDENAGKEVEGDVEIKEEPEKPAPEKVSDNETDAEKKSEENRNVQ